MCPTFREFQRGVVTWRAMRLIMLARVFDKVNHHAAINRSIDCPLIFYFLH